MKWDSILESIAAEILTYIHDLRGSGANEEICWRLARQVAARLQHLGIQEAARKTKSPVMETNSAWAGTIFVTLEFNITQNVSLENGRRQKV